MKIFKKSISLLLALLLIVSVFTGCKSSKPDVPDEPPATTEASEPSTGDAPAAPTFDKLEISMFEGGFAELWTEMVDLFKTTYPGVEVTTDIAPDNAIRVRSRMLGGDPPDVIVVSGPDFSPFEAAQSGLYLPLTDMFANGKTSDGRSYADIINPAILKEGTINGDVYLPPWGTTYGGWWYDGKLFADKGWEIPNNWEDFLSLAPKIKEAGIDPFVYAGFYPNYLIHGYLYGAVASEGGYGAYEDAFVNLKEGAWKSEAMLSAATRLYELVKAGYVYKGVTGIDHTQSQMEFLNGRAAFLPCGTWLEAEMKDSIPEDFELTFMPSPLVDAQNTHYLTTYSSVVGIGAKAKNVEAAKAFLGVMYSVEGQKIIAKYSNIPVVTDIGADDLGELLAPALKTVVDRANQGDIKYVSNNTELWYPALNTELRTNLTNLVLQEDTPEQFCEKMEAVAKSIREDDSIPKYYTESN